jgi:hypothetical protein
MAENTEWFEALTVEEAKEERIIVGLWVGRVVIFSPSFAWWPT